MNKNTSLKLLAVSIAILLACPLFAQERTDSLLEDSVFTFRFLPGKDIFYAPGMNNGEELTKLFECVDRYKDLILVHDISLHVDGYCAPYGSDAENRVLARTRSNRVKSELITRKGLTENCFITRNFIGKAKGNFVTVRLVPNDAIPQLGDTGNAMKPEAVLPVPEEETVGEPVVAASPSDVTDSALPAEIPFVDNVSGPSEDDASESAGQYDNTVTGLQAGSGADGNGLKGYLMSRFVLKTNLLYYVALMPNIEIEWKCADRWSVALEGQRAWYAKNSPHKVYRLATVIPEVRYWVIDRSRWHGMYVGLFAGGGMYDLCNGKKGHEGEGALLGLSAGYMWPIGKYLSLDAGLGIGYLRARDKEYLPLDGHFLYQSTKNINYFGPLRLKLSLVWRFQSENNKR